MAARWRAQQRKQRWEHTVVALPRPVLDLVSRNDASDRLVAFSSSLRQWTGLSNTYEQVSGAKRLVESLQGLIVAVPGRQDELELAFAAYVEVLFQEGSKPVHRTMLSPLSHLHDYAGLLCGIFHRCCVEYGARGCKERRFALVSLGLSLANMPKPGVVQLVVDACASLIASSSSVDVADALQRAREGENPTPALMEECQDAMSTLYYMLQRSPANFYRGDGVYDKVVSASLDVLQTSLMSRDCVVAAAVCLCAAAQMGNAGEQSLAVMMAEAVFPESGIVIGRDSVTMLEDAILGTRGTSFAEEVVKFTEFGRLCVLRGLLTAVPREVLNRWLTMANGEAWTLLFDGILPAVCTCCESSFDSHFKFHAITALQICLQQAKASMMANITGAAFEVAKKELCLDSRSYKPFPAAMTNRIMQIIWNNWEDPLNQTVKQVQMVFDLVADLQSYVEDHGSTKQFLHRVAKDLLTVGAHRKGRYVPLASLALRIGAKKLLEMCPSLLFQTVDAMSDDCICCAGSSFLQVVLERLLEECWSSYGVAEGYLVFRRLWVPPMLAGLVTGNPRLRINLQTYALPVGLEIDGDILLQMLGFVLDGLPTREVPAWEDLRGAEGMPGALSRNQRVAAFVSLIKVARSLALMENEVKASNREGEMELSIKSTTVYAPVVLLELALAHMEDGLRVDAAEIICLNPKTAVMPSPLELHLLKLAMPLNMRCSSTAFRMKWTSLLRKFFSRVKVATDRQVKLSSTMSASRDELNGVVPITDQNGRLSKSVVTLAEMQAFMQWLARLLITSLYPSAPYERKYMAMEILNVMLDVWPTSHLGNKFCPYGKELLSPGYTMILLGAAVDSWDRLRESAFKILARYPTPVPGLESEAAVEEVLSWGKALANSPRVRESDAGALILRLIFRKYVCDLGWEVKLHSQPTAKASPTGAGDGIVKYLESLNDWLEAGVVEGEKDLLKACKHSLVHGVLLTYRYAVSELDWVSDAVRANMLDLRAAFKRLFELLMRVTSLALWVVSADALNLGERQFGEADADNEESTLDNFEFESKVLEGEDEEGDDVELLAPAEQMIMVGCWLSMKEVSLLLGTIARLAPLPGCSFNARSKSVPDGGLEVDDNQFIMLESHQLEAIGQHLLEVLLSMKHNGAIDKTRAGFVALCNRLLLSSETRLSKMPEIWMQQIRAHTVAKGQTLDDLLRRSAGIPASFLALFLSEPDGAPRKLLPMGLSWLINHIKQFNNREAGAPNEDVVPVVHAFNTLRVTFNDTNLSTDTSGFCADGLIVSIEGFSSPYWQVRNGATLAFTALVHRTVGFLNVHKQATARRAITGFEFFHRYPALHPFLLKELRAATTELDGHSSRNKLHPSLAPVLVILSRLRPSIVNTKEDDWLSPSAFMPYVMRCATQCNLQVRALASRALAPLVTSERLSGILLELSGSLHVDGALQKQKRPYNSIHGVLLQLSSLLRNNCLELPDKEKVREMAVEVFRKLSCCTWIGSTSFCSCYIVVEAYLEVLEDLRNVAAQSSSEPEVVHQVEFLLSSLSAENMYPRTAQTQWDSTQVSLRATAARICFRTVFNGWLCLNLEGNVKKYWSFEQAGQSILQSSVQGDAAQVGFYSLLRHALFDSMYEVRLATLKVLKLFEMSSSIPVKLGSDFLQTDAQQLRDLLVERLYEEKQPRCVKRILEAFLSWDLLTLPAQDCSREECTKLWEALFEIYTSSKVSKTREYAVRCLGSCLQRIRAVLKISILAAGDEKQLFKDILGAWTQLISQHSAASQPVTMRRAIASAIISSGCLEDAKWLRQLGNPETASSWYRRIVLSIWSASIKLLEDEDVLLREQMGLAMLNVISSTSMDSHLSPCDPEVPAQVEKVLEASLEFLRLQFDGCVFCFDFLASLVIGGPRNQSYNGVQDADLVRRLFDKELDNHHEEELLVVQLCCLHIQRYVTCMSKPGSFQPNRGQDQQQRMQGEAGDYRQQEQRRQFVLRWRNKFLQQARACTEWCEVLQGSTAWVGGITNHQDAFKSLYRTLLGLLILAAPSSNHDVEDDDGFNDGLVDVTSRLQQLQLVSPLISNLLLRVVKEYQKLDAASSLEETMGESFCDEFEPLFLLR